MEFPSTSQPSSWRFARSCSKKRKTHLKRVVGVQNLTFEEYNTLLTRVEACVNSRPIAPLSDDPNDLSALTPAHFLVGESLITLEEPRNLDEARIHTLDRWELLQQMHQHLWKRWYSEYIMTLSQRTKWKTETQNLKINDSVIVKEDNIPPSRWQLGRIVGIHPGKDGLVRIVQVRTKSGIYVRAITKLGLIPKPDCIYLSLLQFTNLGGKMFRTNLYVLYATFIQN